MTSEREKIERGIAAAKAAGNTDAVGELNAYLEQTIAAEAVSAKASAPAARFDLQNAQAAIPEVGEMLKGAGVVGGSQMAGTAIGSFPPLAAATGGLSVRAGGAIGATLGELMEGMRTGNKPSMGRLAGSATAGFLLSPPSQIVSRGAINTMAPAAAETFAPRAVKEALANISATNIETLVDEKKLASVGEQTISGGAGIAGAALNRFVSSKAGGGSRAALTTQEAYNARALVNTIDDALTSGYKLDPSQVNPNAINNTLVRVAGRSGLQKQLSEHNVKLATQDAMSAIDLDPTTSTLDLATLANQRIKLAEPYREVEKLGGAYKKTFDLIQQQRALWKENLRSFGMARTPDERSAFKAEAQKHLEKAEWGERVLDRMVEKTSNPGLVNELRYARKKLAQWYLVDGATNTDVGLIEPAILAAVHDKNRDLLTGKLRTVAATANAFPEVMGAFSTFSKPDHESFRTALITGAGAVGYKFGDVPGAVMAATAMYNADVPAKALAKLPFWQEVMAHPSYNLKSPELTAEFLRYAANATGRDAGRDGGQGVRR